MENKISLEFSENFTVVEIIENDFKSHGIFKSFMEFVEKIEELHSKKSISDLNIAHCMNIYLRNSKITTDFFGSMTPILIISKRFPFLKLNIPKLKYQIFLLKFEHRKSCMFGYFMGNTYYALSEYILFSFEAYEFLDYLKTYNLISDDTYENFVVSIKSDIFFHSFKEEICN